MLLAINFPMQSGSRILASRRNTNQAVANVITDIERPLEFGAKRLSQLWAQRGLRVTFNHRAFPNS